jgi:hypothetical protein
MVVRSTKLRDPISILLLVESILFFNQPINTEEIARISSTIESSNYTYFKKEPHASTSQSLFIDLPAE